MPKCDQHHKYDEQRDALGLVPNVYCVRVETLDELRDALQAAINALAATVSLSYEVRDVEGAGRASGLLHDVGALAERAHALALDLADAPAEDD